jgi:hypothetical protein
MPRREYGKPCPQRGNPGEANPAAKLCEEDVLWIRATDAPCRYVAAVLGVYHATISAIRRGETWKHLMGEEARPA